MSEATPRSVLKSLVDWTFTLPFLLAFGLLLALFVPVQRLARLFGRRPQEYAAAALQWSLWKALPEAHLLSLDYLDRGGSSDVFNCGYGHGHSVKDVIRMVRKVTGKDFRVVDSERRPGDPPVLVADCAKLKARMNWKPKHDDLEFIVTTAWDWEKKRRP